MQRTALLLLVLTAAGAVGLAGCGRRGPLEPPPDQVLPKGADGKPVDRGPEKPDRPFVLDGLLN
jgi:predicted small lipoprotein YifL